MNESLVQPPRIILPEIPSRLPEINFWDLYDKTLDPSLCEKHVVYGPREDNSRETRKLLQACSNAIRNRGRNPRRQRYWLNQASRYTLKGKSSFEPGIVYANYIPVYLPLKINSIDLKMEITSTGINQTVEGVNYE